MWFKTLSSVCIGICRGADRRRTFEAGCFALHNRARNRQNSYDRRFGASLDPEFDSLLDEATPERHVLEKEKFRQMGKAIRALTDCERECLLLRAEGLRYREIGEVLEIPTSTVGDTVDRAVKKLAEKCNV